MLRFLFVVLCIGCSAPESVPIARPAAKPTRETPASPAKPAELSALLAATAALCACNEAQCAEPAYEAMSEVVGERDLSAWTAAERALFHEARWKGEDCNLEVLAAGDAEVLEHAREALRDRVAGDAPEIIEAVYQRARLFHLEGSKLPESSRAPTPELGACCAWSDGLCRPDPADWSVPPWSELGFAVEKNQAYSISYERRGLTVEVSAVGDIDCDGEYGTLEVRGDLVTQDVPLIRLTNHLE